MSNPPSPRTRKPKAPPQPLRTNMRLTVWVTLLILFLDQALKYYVVHVLQLDRVRAIDVIPPWLNLRMAWNQGVNFGLMSSEDGTTRYILIGIAVVIVLWVWVWVWRINAGKLAKISAGLLIGGALGNVIDRFYYGAVADFLNMSLPNFQNPYSFNVADIAIFAGAIGLVLLPQKQPEPVPPPRKPRQKRTKTAPEVATNQPTDDKPRDESDISR